MSQSPSIPEDSTSYERKVLITRHLERIDDGSDSSIDLMRKWNTVDRKNPEYHINPYISDINSLHKLVSKLQSQPYCVDYVISSPFLRCVQTAILISHQLNSTQKQRQSHCGIHNINIDYRLAEWNDSVLFDVPYNTDVIFG